MEFWGVRILGLNGETGSKLLFSAVVLAVALGVRAALRAVPVLGLGPSRRRTWLRKGIRLGVGAIATLLLLSIWFDNPTRLATFTGLILAGAAFASQNAVLSIAGYFVVVFGKTFDFGDRVQIGDVRGDVLDIGLFKTTIMEMGVPPIAPSEGLSWISARQYTGRVVTVPNSEVFKAPTYNYTRNFNFLWEEMRLPLHFDADLHAAEAIAIEAARLVTAAVIDDGRRALEHMRERYLIRESDLEPRAYIRITDNWVELTLRFLVRAVGVRELKDQLARRVLERFRAAHIAIASSTVEISGLPRLVVEADRARNPAGDR